MTSFGGGNALLKDNGLSNNACAVPKQLSSFFNAKFEEAFAYPASPAAQAV
jgi:hypothetical protein